MVVFSDVGNGSTLAGRSQLDAALKLLERGDELLALHPDRLARGTADLLTIAQRVVEKGAVLRIDDPKIIFDCTDIMAEMMLTMLGLIGSGEKHFIKSRQQRGIEARKAKGLYKGRPATIRPKISGSFMPKEWARPRLRSGSRSAEPACIQRLSARADGPNERGKTKVVSAARSSEVGIVFNSS